MIDPTRLKDKISLKRILLDTKRSVGSTIVIILGVVVLIAGATFLITGVSSTLGRSTYTARFAVRDVTGVVPGVDQVRYRGIVAGVLESVSRVNGQLVVTGKFRKGYGPIYKNAEADLLPATPLEDMYLDVVDPGTPSAGTLTADDVLPASQTSGSVNVDDVLDALGPDEREHLQQLLANLGTGLQGRGAALRELFLQLAPIIQVAGKLSHAVALRSSDTKALIHNVGVLTNTLAARNRTLKTLVVEGNATFGTLQEGSADLNSTLEQLPPTFTSLRTGFASIQGIIGKLNTAVTSLDPVATQLPNALTAVRSLNSELSPAVSKLQAPVKDLVPLANTLPSIASSLHGTFSALTPAVPVIDRTTEDLDRCEDGVIGFFQWNASITKLGDFRGPVPRGQLVVGTPDTGAPGLAKRQPGPSCVVGGPTQLGGQPETPGEDH